MLIYFVSAGKRLLWLLINFGFSRAGACYAMGRAFEESGRQAAAYRAFVHAETAARQLHRTEKRQAFKITQLCEFKRVCACVESGKEVKDGVVSEPLTRCRLAGLHARSSRSSGKPAGVFDVSFSHLGLRLDGFVMPAATSERHLELKLNGQLIRTIPLSRKGPIPPFFHYQLKREVLVRFPEKSELVLSTAEGEALVTCKCPVVQIELPHGDGSIFEYLEAGGRIDKKGFLALTPDTIHARQARYLDIYSEARKYFTEQFGSPLFVMYGTLLGLVREGDFIQGDDDFDAGYISHQTNAKAVKQETMDLVVNLVLSGFTCSFNRNGRLFRLRLKDDKPDVHLDVRPVWYEEDHIWAHKQARLPLTVDDFLPVETRELRGVPVDVPRNAESFLKAYYGEGWQVPDPTFSNASQKVPRRVKKKLNSVCITPADYQSMQADIEARRADHPNAGKLIATGLHPLYPLEEYEANCEW